MSVIKNHKHRKKIHFFILISLLILLSSIFIIINNEFKNQNKLKLLKSNTAFIIESEKDIDLTLSKLHSSKESLYGYLLTSNPNNYRKYFRNLDSLKFKINELKNDQFIDSGNSGIEYRKNLDSFFKVNREHFKNKRVKPEYFLNDFKIDSVIKIDSLKNKNFFGRLIDAILGKVNVQKETLEINKVKSYEKNIETNGANEELKSTPVIHKAKHREFKLFLKTNNALLSEIESYLDHYKININNFKAINNQELEDFNNNLINNTRIIGFYLLLLVCIMFTALFLLTIYAFNNEKKLIVAKEINTQHILLKNKIITLLTHETKTPLSLVSIFSEKLENSIKDESSNEIFKLLKHASNSLINISAQILKLLNSEEMNYTVKDFNLSKELIQLTSSLNILIIQNKNLLEIETDLADLNFEVKESIPKLQQLFYNVIENANKFTNKGLITLSYSYVVQNKILNVTFKIKDNGIGISKENLKLIFNKNHQANVNHNSNGLGLYISKQIVESFNGHIMAESIINEGTLITFSLNLNLSNNEE